jgi:hypothetical protein
MSISKNLQKPSYDLEKYKKFVFSNIVLETLLVLVIILSFKFFESDFYHSLWLKPSSNGLLNSKSDFYFNLMEVSPIIFLLLAIILYIREIFVSEKFNKSFKLGFFLLSLIFSSMLFIWTTMYGLGNPTRTSSISFWYMVSYYNFPIINFLNDIFEYFKTKQQLKNNQL